MPGFFIYMVMLNVKYNYSSVHVEVTPPLSEEIIKWGRQYVTDDDIYVRQKDPTFGREDEIHVTILYGLHSEKPDQTISLLRNNGPVKAKLGRMDVFTTPRYFDVLMIEVISPDLYRLNELLHKNVSYTNKYGCYRPHLTIAYVKKGKGYRHIGASYWEGREFTCTQAVFSSKNGSRKSFTI